MENVASLRFLLQTHGCKFKKHGLSRQALLTAATVICSMLHMRLDHCEKAAALKQLLPGELEFQVEFVEFQIAAAISKLLSHVTFTAKFPKIHSL